MPIYEYMNRRTGEMMMVRVPVAERKDRLIQDGQVFERLTVPSSVTVLRGHGALGECNDVLKGYYKQEQKLGSRFKSEFKAETIKRAWSTPYEKD
jgi:hypothetical protein